MIRQRELARSGKPIKEKQAAMKFFKTISTLVFLGTISGTLACAAQQSQANDVVPVYRITVVDRTTKAINYKHRSGSTPIDFRGTVLLPASHGNAKVQSKQGAIHIDAEFRDLQPASKFGPEYLTYVLWAISPEGRPVNLGEILLNHDGNGGKSKLDATCNLQAFGMIVTAEPYFAVTQPSDVVVMENEIRSDTVGSVEQVEAKYELLQRGQYGTNVSPSDFKPIVLSSDAPLELYEARNAVRIANWTGARRYAPDSIQKAELSLSNAEGYKGNHNKAQIALAREAVQTSEDARVITVKKINEERHENERAAAAAAQANSNASANEANRQNNLAQAETARAQADLAQSQSNAAASSARADEANRQADEANRQKEQAQSNLATNQADSSKTLAQAQADTDEARRSAQRSQEQAQQADSDRAAMRTKLRDQLNSVLQTRDSARGLIVNMSDVLFDTGKYALLPGAREKLSKVAGILLSYPGLNVEVDGHTDNVGNARSNQTLSENRATSVSEYLVKQGVLASSLSSKGFGDTQPVTSNANATGRQQNRRVELVVSGELIGKQASSVSKLD